MINGRVTGVRSIELGVRDLHQSAEFYTRIWALEEVASEGDSIHFRATGGEHHVLTIRERPKPSLLGVHFSAPDRAAVDALCARAKGYGIEGVGDPAPLAGAAGGGYGFRFETPDGLPMSISSDIVQHPDVVVDRSRPTKISHVVLNSARTQDQVPFFVDVLGFKLSDSTHMMEFLRCSADHHSVAIFRNNGPSLNHVAYELPNMDGLMRGAGRVKQSGYDIEWGSRTPRPGQQHLLLFHRAEWLRGGIYHGARTARRRHARAAGPRLLAKSDARSGPLGNGGAAVEPDACRHVGRALSRRRAGRRSALRRHHRSQARLRNCRIVRSCNCDPIRLCTSRTSGERGACP